MNNGLFGVDYFNMANCFLECSESKCGEIFAHFFGDEFKEVDHKLWLATETRTQFWVLRSDANWACVEVANTHHDATTHNEWCGCESIFFSTQQRRDDHIATGLHLAIGLHHNAVAESIHHEGLLCFSESKFPRTAGVFKRGQRRRTCATVVARDQNHIGLGLRYTGSNSADSYFSHQLHVDAGSWV